jgi:uncharacterized membrane protein YgdD (TMEM256/DUF423 family)
MHRLWIVLGALAGLLAVALAAWATHAAPGRLAAPQVATLGHALTMLGWHAPALLAAGLWAERRGGLLPHIAGAAFALGTLLFCGALLLAALRSISLGPVAPAGGVLLILGWALLALSALLRAKPRRDVGPGAA